MSYLSALMKQGSHPSDYLEFAQMMEEWTDTRLAQAVTAFNASHVEMLFGRDGALFVRQAISCTRAKLQSLLDHGFSAHTILKAVIELYQPENEITERQQAGLLSVVQRLLPACKYAAALDQLHKRAAGEIAKQIQLRVQKIRNPHDSDLDSDGEEGEDLLATQSVDAQEGLEDRSTAKQHQKNDSKSKEHKKAKSSVAAAANVPPVASGDEEGDSGQDESESDDGFLAKDDEDEDSSYEQDSDSSGSSDEDEAEKAPPSMPQDAVVALLKQVLLAAGGAAAATAATAATTTTGPTQSKKRKRSSKQSRPRTLAARGLDETLIIQGARERPVAGHYHALEKATRKHG